MSQLDKLIAEVLALNPNLRFDQLCKVLVYLGYTMKQPRGGSSHYTFRKDGCAPITVPKQSPLNRAYIELVADAIRAYYEEE